MGDKSNQEQQLEAADKKRIADSAKATIATSDEQRMLATRREADLDRLAGDLPDDPKALWMYAEHSLAQASVSSLDAGRALIKLKEIVPRGEFGPALKERNISTSTASNLMNVAARFSKRLEKFQHLGRSQLYACLEFSDDQLNALEDGESVLGLQLDDLDKMTARELRAAIKKRDADISVKDQLLSEKNSRIDDLATELEHTRGAVKPGELSPMAEQARNAALAVQTNLITLKAIIDQADEEDPVTLAIINGQFEELRGLFAACRETMLTRFPNFHFALDDASETPWKGAN